MLRTAPAKSKLSLFAMMMQKILGTSFTSKKMTGVYLMKARCFARSHRLDSGNGNETRCFVCDNRVFRVGRVSPELIMLICENCGESHMIEADSDKGKIYLKFWSSEV